jgi:hypothetical protein
MKYSVIILSKDSCLTDKEHIYAAYVEVIKFSFIKPKLQKETI